jgi:hypothetical protein
MTTRRLALALLIAPAMIGIGLLLFAWLNHEPGVTRSNYHRVRVGISKADVETIFGSASENTFTAVVRAKYGGQAWFG